MKYLFKFSLHLRSLPSKVLDEFEFGLDEFDFPRSRRQLAVEFVDLRLEFTHLRHFPKTAVQLLS